MLPHFPWPVALWSAILLILSLLLYHQVTKRISSRRRADQAPRSKFGVVPVEGVQHGLGTQLRRDGVDIVFVHGLGSNPDSTWRAQPPRDAAASSRIGGVDNDGVCWVTDLLLDDLPPAVRRKTRIFFYNHDSYWQRDALRTRLWNLAGNMLHYIQERVRRTEEERARGLVFVGYSYGGLLVKQALVRAKNDPALQDIVNQTRGIIFLGTPHRGSSFTQLGSVVASFLRPLGSNPSILEEIMYDSLNLQDLHEQFTCTTGSGLKVYNFYEERPTRLVGIGFLQWTKLCVEEQSAKYFDSSPYVHNIGLAVDHSGLNKFGSRTAEYEILRDKLVGLLPRAPQDVYSVPTHRVDTYMSREELSQRIHEALQPSLSDGAQGGEPGVGDFRGVIIHGMGGVGKTQLALNYAEENRGFYNPIFWIDAHTPETVRMSFERGALALGLKFDNSSTTHSALKDSPVVAGVLRWFLDRDEEDRRWLVVVDNADDTSWRVEEIIPQGHQGRVIVTSQHRQSAHFLGGHCKFVTVGDMARDEARALLEKHVRVKSEQTPSETKALYDQVVDRLGCLALAVDLAGAYLNEQLEFHDGEAGIRAGEETVNTLLRRYLEDYQLHQDELLQWAPFYRLSSYEKTVWTVWDTSLAAIEKTSPSNYASQILTFLAHFHLSHMEEEMFRLASGGWSVMVDRLQLSSQDVPDWLQQVVASNGEGWDDFYYRQATQPLTRYGLLQRLGGDWAGTTMHGLVQWRARKAQEESSRAWRRWMWLFMAAVVCQTNCEKARPLFRRHVIVHLLGMGDVDGERGEDLQLDERSMWWLWTAVGEAYYDEGRWPEAEELEVQVMETRKRVLGAEHPDTLTSMGNLASTYWNQGRWPEAEELQVQVMETRKRVLGAEHPATLNSMGNLASTYRRQGRWPEAEELQVQVMETTKRVLGAEHPATLTSMGNLASTYRRQGRWPEAEELDVQVMGTTKRVLGAEHPSTLTSMGNLASTYREQGRWPEAEELDVQVMGTTKRVLGAEHPSTLTSMGNLASTYREQGRWPEAEELEVQVMETTKRVLGAEHPDTLTSIGNLASTYWNQGRWPEAEELDVQVMGTTKRVLGAEHPDTLTSMGNLASTYRDQGRWPEAEELEVQVMETTKRVLGAEHPDALTSMSNLAFTLKGQGRNADGVKLMAECVQLQSRVLGPQHPDTLSSAAVLAKWQSMN